MNRILTLAVCAIALAWPASGITLTTTLENAIGPSDQQLVLASVTGLVSGDELYIEREAMKIFTITGRILTVSRSFDGTRAVSHAAGTAIVGGSILLFTRTAPSGACTATTTLLDVTTGFTWTCTAGVWLSSGGSGGGSIASTLLPLKGDGAGAGVPAAAADIVGLFATCSGVKVLAADGTCVNNTGAVTSVIGRTGVVVAAQDDYSPALLNALTISRATTVLTIGGNLSASLPANVAVNGTAYRFTSSSTITISSGTPTVRIYISDGSDGATAGTLKVRNSAASGVACSAGCTVENSQSAFPTSGGVIPLYQWSAAVATTWDATGTDYRPFLGGGKRLIAGANITLTEGTAGTTVDATAAGCTPIAGTANGDFWQPWHDGVSFTLGVGGNIIVAETYNKEHGWLAPLPNNCTIVLSKMWLVINTAAGAVDSCTGATENCYLSVVLRTLSGATIYGSKTLVSGGSPDINTTGFIQVAFAAPITITGPFFVGMATNSDVVIAGSADTYATPGNTNYTRIGSCANAGTFAASLFTPPATCGTKVASAANYARLPALYFE